MIIVAVVAGRANQKGTDKIMTASVFTPHIKLEHVISFSDAVFAFAITLMALSIDIPDLPLDLTQSELLEKLYGIYPQFENYLISFAVVAIFWISYHQVFNHIRGSHISMVYLNLLFLLLITLRILSDTLHYLLYGCNYGKFFACSDMVVCHKRTSVCRQRHASISYQGYNV